MSVTDVIATCFPACALMAPTDSTTISVNYNPTSTIVQAPHLSTFTLNVTDTKNSMNSKAKTFDWPLTTPYTKQQNVTFVPSQWVNASSLAVRLQWKELNFDNTIAKIGDTTAFYIEVSNSPQITSTTAAASPTGSNVQIIGSGNGNSNSAVKVGYNLLLLVPFLVQ
ncbi:hypothetical protein HK103_003766 [Boothiomyces macroporosus]|uniref:Uncharacterized protein n=1 Tax=Boothiomyces macroporosus TaxID=261099 RepID=A0AAD5UKE2_9FUNG|nr:hypothetical protein HK103_003766 [Boothiomyces macroporosus]